jgi:hypothetical protein
VPDVPGDGSPLLIAHVDNSFLMMMDASKVSFHTPATKPLSKRWLEKDLVPSRHIKSTPPRTKQIVLVFFDSKGFITLTTCLGSL